MIYFKSIVHKLTDSSEIISKVKNLESDEDILLLLNKNGISDEKVFQAFEEYYGVKYINLKLIKINQKIFNNFNIDAFQMQSILPYEFDEDKKIYYFAINEILNKKLTQNIQYICNKLSATAIFSFSLKSHISEKYEELKKTSKKPTTQEDDIDVVKLVNSLINEGISTNASDIHIECLETYMRVRYRIDGLLTNKKEYFFDANSILALGVRIKILSGMDISEKRKPQDGRIDNYVFKNNNYDIRISSVRAVYGEKFVMRLIEKSSDVKTFDDLGFSSTNKEKIKRMLNNQNGIIYLAGATGSGKTTTLYTMIEHLNNDAVNIYTIENPVEKTIPNVNQIEINPLAGIDYSTILKCLLRQDPDIIVVGEIRDVETAKLSVRASLTGHLVLTTVHANNALDSIERLIDMEVEPYLLSASTIGIASQRLTRKLCPHCKTKVKKLKGYERVWLDKMSETFNLDYMSDDLFYESNGCSHCNNGYSGRIAIIEILEMDDAIKDLLSKSRNSSAIKKEIMSTDFKPLIVDGIEKALAGITTIQELIKQLT